MIFADLSIIGTYNTSYHSRIENPFPNECIKK